MLDNCVRCNLPTADGVCRQFGCSAAWEALIREREENLAAWQAESYAHMATQNDLVESNRQIVLLLEAAGLDPDGDLFPEDAAAHVARLREAADATRL